MRHKNATRCKPKRNDRIKTHIFVVFVAYCLQVTLRRRLRDLAAGVSARSVFEKFTAVQMINGHLPSTDGGKVIFSRYTPPEDKLKLFPERLTLELLSQAPRGSPRPQNSTNDARVMRTI